MPELNTPEKILARIRTDPDGCWRWTGMISREGYGVTAYQRERVLVHRLLYALTIGPIPAGHQIDHLCRTRECCNPAHLEAVTRQTNIRRGARSFDLTGYCRKGLHKIGAPGSTRRNGAGNRTCAECRKISQQRKTTLQPTETENMQ